MDYENNILLKKIIEIEQKPSLYNPSNLKLKTCPANENKKNNFKTKFAKLNLNVENYVLYV